MITTNDEAIASRLRLLRSHGMTTLTWDRHKGHSFSYDVVAPGYNYRLDDLRAALGLVQLSRLEATNEERRRLTHFYREKLKESSQVQIPFLPEMVKTSACHIFPILLPTSADRSHFMTYLASLGIQTSIHYPPIHRFTYYKSRYGDISLPRTVDISAREVTLPLYPGMGSERVDLVVDCVIRTIEANKT